MLDLIRDWLKADILKGSEKWTPVQGSPRHADACEARRAVISPLLANIYLDPLDRLLAERGYRMVRYADDFVILCRSREEADAALDLVRCWVTDNGLTLHPTKTHVGDCRLPGQGFEFVMPKACFQHDGYRFEDGRRFVRKKSMDKLKDKIREKTKRTCGQSLAVVIADLNRTSCGTHACGMTRLVRLLQAGSPHHLQGCPMGSSVMLQACVPHDGCDDPGGDGLVDGCLAGHGGVLFDRARPVRSRCPKSGAAHS